MAFSMNAVSLKSYCKGKNEGSDTVLKLNECTEVQNPRRMCHRTHMRLSGEGKMANSRSSHTMLEGLWLCNKAVSEKIPQNVVKISPC